MTELEVLPCDTCTKTRLLSNYIKEMDLVTSDDAVSWLQEALLCYVICFTGLLSEELMEGPFP